MEVAAINRKRGTDALRENPANSEFDCAIAITILNLDHKKLTLLGRFGRAVTRFCAN